MAWRLSKTMVRVLLVMAAGEEIWMKPYQGHQFHPNREDWGKAPHAATVRALADRGLIEIYETVDEEVARFVLRWPHYRLTPKGTELVEKEWEEWMME